MQNQQPTFPAECVDFCDEGLVFTLPTELDAQRAHLEAIRVGSYPTQVRGNQLLMVMRKAGQDEVSDR